MKSLVFLSAFTTVALAQSSTTSAAAADSTANSLIPTGISSGCGSFLKSLDVDSSFSSCTSPLIAATSQFGPGSSSTPSSATISSALSTLCSTSASSCTDQTVRGKLADFYSACTIELTANPKSDVLRIYDVLYALLPLKQAVCTKDSSGKYCVTEVTNPSSGQSFWSQTSNTKRATGQTAAVIPNTTAFRQTNLLFFFLTAQTASATLCTTCSRNVLMSYFNFEQSVPYGPGFANSPLLGGQSDLYNHISSTCGKTFLGGAVQAAGSISSSSVGGTSAALRSASHSFSGIVSAIIGTVAIGFAAIL